MAALMLGGAIPGIAAAQMRGPAGPVSVGVVTLEEQDIPVTVTVPGRAVAYESVDIRPRVSGMISEIAYQPGLPLERGDVLFRIESETYEAELATAEARVALAEAAQRAADATVTRYEALEGTGISTGSLETARVASMQAAADLSSARASLQIARLNLERTEITSPISGRATVPGVSVGTLVTENQADALTTVTRVDPIYVDIEESSRRIGEMRARFSAGALQRGESLEIALRLETGAIYPGRGELVSPGVAVSTTTGTTSFRIRFDNPDRLILPGQFLRAELTLGTTAAILVPQMATSRSSSGALTAYVVADGVARQRVLTSQGTHGNGWVVTEGVAPGEQLVVDGLTNLSDGAEVAPVAVMISDQGVVTPADGSSQAFTLPDAPAGN
ncbi:efflux RND transporter periplasmic adaptor subunit [Rhodobacter sp. NTK016B]|nr:efflux RND transporter periplasmic adaptor subunit [Rhodobacter sp. NTK016B]